MCVAIATPFSIGFRACKRNFLCEYSWCCGTASSNLYASAVDGWPDHQVNDVPQHKVQLGGALWPYHSARAHCCHHGRHCVLHIYGACVCVRACVGVPGSLKIQCCFVSLSHFFFTSSWPASSLRCVLLALCMPYCVSNCVGACRTAHNLNTATQPTAASHISRQYDSMTHSPYHPLINTNRLLPARLGLTAAAADEEHHGCAGAAAVPRHRHGHPCFVLLGPLPRGRRDSQRVAPGDRRCTCANSIQTAPRCKQSQTL